jgi:hypothetical protein
MVFMKFFIKLAFAFITLFMFQASTHAQARRDFAIRVSAFAGFEPVAFINARNSLTFGLRAGVQLPSGIYGGFVAAIHPFVVTSIPDRSFSATPVVLGGEAGYEFVLTPTMFLRPYIGLCRFGVDGSYRGNNLTMLPEMETTEFMFGVTYSIEVARDLLVGAELRGVNRGGLHLCLHAGFRL